MELGQRGISTGTATAPPTLPVLLSLLPGSGLEGSGHSQEEGDGGKVAGLPHLFLGGGGASLGLLGVLGELQGEPDDISLRLVSLSRLTTEVQICFAPPSTNSLALLPLSISSHCLHCLGLHR